MKKLGLVFIWPLVFCTISLSVNSAEKNVKKTTIIQKGEFVHRGCQGPIEVNIFPEQLDSGDILTDGPDGVSVEIENYTMLVWIDRAPGDKFAHSSEYILISSSGVRVIAGQWWPVLNGKRILHGEPNDTNVFSPFFLRAPAYHRTENVNVHTYPYVLTEKDTLKDDILGATYSIDENTFFIWVDLYPGARFAHGSAYVLISASNTRVYPGMWTPQLNGKTILFGRNNFFITQSPTFIPEN